MRINHLINGKSVPSRNYFETINPATQEVLAEVALGGENEVNAAVAAAKAAFPAWAATPAPQRAKLIRRLGELIAADVPTISETETNDCGQVIAQTRKQLVPRAADNFSYFAEMCTRVDGHTYPTETHLNYTLFHPVGVCALISPWNVPFMTATWKVAPCLAFGNTAVLKMSELSPLSAARLGALALEAGIPAGVLNLVHGYGKDAGEPLCRHPDVRAISFTGSTATGNRIVQSAGLKKFSMELGGKSPFVVFDDADQARALDAALFMIFSNNGERCTAGSRILVQQSVYADFVQKFTERTQRISVGDPLIEATIVGPMISQTHLAKVRSYIELGPREGATLMCGGLATPDLPARVQRGNYVLPTVFADVDNRMRIAQEEIFGPVACLIPFLDEADAIRQANDISYGLSSYVWTENIGRALGVDTLVVFDTHWLVNASYHINCAPHFQGRYTSNELPHFISNLPYECAGNPVLGKLLAKAGTEFGVETLAHDATTLAPEYGTLVPLRYMNADQHFKVVSVSALCMAHYLGDSARLGWAMRRAVEEHYDGTVAFLASGSLSHRFAQNGLAPEFAFKVWSPFLEALDCNVVQMWQQARWKPFCDMLPEYAAKGHGEGFMHDTAMLLGSLGWSDYDGHADIITPYFGASGTGQINAVFPVTPQSGHCIPAAQASCATGYQPVGRL